MKDEEECPKLWLRVWIRRAGSLRGIAKQSRMRESVIAPCFLAVLALAGSTAYAPAFAGGAFAGGAFAGVAPDQAQLHTLLMEVNVFFSDANKRAGTDPEGAKDLYQKAILRFERIIHDGGVRNGKLYYNLGNAYFLTEDIGRAILNYRRAERYIPNDPNLHQNLDYVRNQRLDRIEEPQKTRVLKTLFFWHYDLAMRTRGILFVLFSLGLWVCASVRLFKRHALLTWGIAGCVALSALLFGSVAVEAVGHARDRSGVLLAGEVIARKGDGDTYQPSFKEPLHAGAEFALVEDRPAWRHIQLRDGRRCWIPREASRLVRETPAP